MTTLPEKVYYQINRGSWTRGKSTRWSGDDGMMSFPGKKNKGRMERAFGDRKTGAGAAKVVNAKQGVSGNGHLERIFHFSFLALLLSLWRY